ncbi:sulfotransferase family protein [Wenxinia marina]|uniref:Sulfotransferase n=1 Tax=Wenxinia marina DSM 24838 TaxID=1123501 RepID=A0A0D0QA90_9RHOB|nr:sulfotransferase [Wenxinia marina]KIQ71389.1 hypothetical protein Wenmar_04100 [Wenxinia marina DSM 24838]GGL79148.1 hypothetical protein GCM10011392_37040 [Wenxinia marina]
MTKTIAFVGGAQRSGTTALRQFLSSHPRVAILHERFAHLANKPEFGPHLFTSDQIVEAGGEGEGQRRFDGPVMKAMAAKWDDATVVGDKIPKMHSLIAAARRVPGSKVVAIVREPYGMAQSFQKRYKNEEDGFGADFKAAVKQFNFSVQTLAAIDTRNEDFDLCVVQYHDLVADPARLGYVFEFLGVDVPSHEAMSMYQLKDTDRRREESEIASYVSRNARVGLYRKVLERFSGDMSNES